MKAQWPLSWYMRLYPNHKFYGAAPNSDNMSAPVIIVGPENYDKVHPYVMHYVKRTYRLVWWPDMDYFNMTWIASLVRFSIHNSGSAQANCVLSPLP
ncbi:MAG: hypothetical protein R2867_32100 [Caldilineaceae bacterium]